MKRKYHVSRTFVVLRHSMPCIYRLATETILLMANQAADLQNVDPLIHRIHIELVELVQEGDCAVCGDKNAFCVDARRLFHNQRTQAGHIIGVTNSACDFAFDHGNSRVRGRIAEFDRIHERYPDILVAVLSGYQDFEYLSHALRTQAFDYLLKPVTQDALKSLLPRIREAHTQRKRGQLQAMLSARIRRVSEKGLPKVELPERLGVMLLCAGGMPYTQDTELCPGAPYWESIPLDELVSETLHPYTEFSWAFMGNTPVERVVLLDLGQCGSVKELAEYLHEQLLK